MMMAADSSPPTPVLADATLANVRDALAGFVGSPARPDGVRDALCAMAEEARGIGMPPERVLVALKRLWFEVLDHQRLDHGPEQTRMLQQIVSLCIREYYGA